MYYEIRKIKVDELYKLSSLYTYDDINKFITETDKDIIDRKKDIFIIDTGEKLIGELTAIYESKLRYETIPNVRVYLSAFRVHKDFQNRGFGRKLVEYTLKNLEEEGYSQFTIGVEDDNYNAKHIYESYGFTRIIDRGSETIGDKTYEYNLLLRENPKEHSSI